MSRWKVRRWSVAVVVTLVLALVTGVPTGIIHTSFYSRMTPVLWWNYPVWALSAVLAGLLAATYSGKSDAASGGVTGRVSVGGVLSALAIGCPVCNKVVVALLGVSGALGIWAPLQPLLGVASVGLLGLALWLRVRTPPMCKLPTPAEGDASSSALADLGRPRSFQEFTAQSETSGAEQKRP